MERYGRALPCHPVSQLLQLFIALNNLIISYIPFIAMYKQLNLVPIYNIIFYVWCSWGCGVCVGRGWLGVCCGASVDLELSCLETLLSLEVKGSSEGILYDEIYIMIIDK